MVRDRPWGQQLIDIYYEEMEKANNKSPESMYSKTFLCMTLLLLKDMSYLEPQMYQSFRAVWKQKSEDWRADWRKNFPYLYR